MADPRATEHDAGDGGYPRQRSKSKIDNDILAIIEAITMAQADPAPSSPSSSTKASPGSSRSENLFARLSLPPCPSSGVLHRRNATRARSTSNGSARPYESGPSETRPLRIDTSARRLSELLHSRELDKDDASDIPNKADSSSIVHPLAGPSSAANSPHPPPTLRSPTPPSLVFPIAQPSGPCPGSDATVLPLVPIQYRQVSPGARGTATQPLPTSPTHHLSPGCTHPRFSDSGSTLDRLDSFPLKDQHQGSTPLTLSLPVPRIGNGSVARSDIPPPQALQPQEGIDAARVAERRRRMSERFLADRKARRRSHLAGRAKDDTELTEGYVLVPFDRQAGTHTLAVLDEETDHRGEVGGEVWDRDARAVMDTLDKTRRTSSEFRDWERKQRSELVRRDLQAKIISPT